MGFYDLIQTAKEPPDDGLPPSLYDDLTAEYDALSQGSAAKVGELETRVKGYESEISRLKSVNYDLLMSSAADNGDQENKEPEDNSPQGIDQLFG